MTDSEILDAIMRRVVVQAETSHWLWIGTGFTPETKDIKLTLEGRPIRIRRWLYEMHVGPVPGLNVSLNCGHPRCVSPHHCLVVKPGQQGAPGKAQRRGVCRTCAHFAESRVRGLCAFWGAKFRAFGEPVGPEVKAKRIHALSLPPRGVVQIEQVCLFGREM